MPDFRSQIKANQIPIIGLVPESNSVAPASPVAGQLWYDTTAAKLKAYQGGAWVIAVPDPVTLSNAGAPTADVSFANFKITNLAAPINAGDAANKGYVDTAIQGLSAKDAVRAATTANIALNGVQTIDGINVVAGDRVLVKNQTTASENGIYVVASGAWTRATDADAAGELNAAFVFVESGTVNVDTGWVQTTDNPTVGTSAISWTQFSGAGSITAGTGLLKSGNTLSVDFAASGTSNTTQAVRADDARLSNARTPTGAAGGDLSGTYPNPTIPTITVGKGGTGATTVAQARANLGAAGVYDLDLPAITAGTGVVVTHNLSRQGAHVVIYEIATGLEVFMDIQHNSANALTVKSDISAAANTYHITVIG